MHVKVAGLGANLQQQVVGDKCLGGGCQNKQGQRLKKPPLNLHSYGSGLVWGGGGWISLGVTEQIANPIFQELKLLFLFQMMSSWKLHV